jgi:Zn-dependent M28 family amino/carboxypeptidase
MKKWFGLLLFVLVALVTINISTFFSQPQALPIANHSPVAHPQFQSQPQYYQIDSNLLVSVDRLSHHIQNLNFQRYTNQERSHARDYIITELKKFGWQPQSEKFAQGVNIFAQRQGTNKKSGAILVAAHYDTVKFSPGADDNSTGIAVMLEIARLLANYPTNRTLQLVFFDKEEAGLLGSRSFVNQGKHLQNLQGVIVMDMVGYACHVQGCQKYPVGLPVVYPSTDQGDFLAVIGDSEHLNLLDAFQNSATITTNPALDLPKLPGVLTLPVPLKGLLTPDTLRSDHAPFWYRGIGAVLVTDTANLRTPYYHKPSDVPKTIEYEFFRGSAQIVLNATSNLLF